MFVGAGCGSLMKQLDPRCCSSMMAVGAHE
jgi:hypothetical protein